MVSKSIELSEEVYKKLVSLKEETESWDDFLTRLTESLKFIIPTDQQWREGYSKIFNENKEVFQNLAK